MEYRRLPRTVRGDPFRLRQIFLHLLSNAIKFTHHGEISILAQGVERTKHAYTLSIAIKDTGIGIAPEQQSLLFSPFSRLHPAYEGRYPGAGLGLALASQLIADLNGRIECTSQPGQGSVFTCFFPLRRVCTEPQPKNSGDLKSCSLSSTPANKTPSHPRWQVLCVEDNHLVQIAVKNQLTALNCDVECAENGVQALACAAQKTYHIIFLDIGLPDMDGCETARRIRQNKNNPNHSTPIIALTAHVGADNQQTCLDAGMQRVLTKPLQADQAREVIHQYAGKSCSISKMKTLELLADELSPLIAAINHHPLYSHICTLADLRIFMECHVFCVWDFMCLLKELQRRLVTTSAPWFPPNNAENAHLINSILVEEEGDLAENGQSYLCHFDLYLAAMRQIGADTQPIQNFLHGLRQGYSLETAIQQTTLPLPAAPFVTATFSFFSCSTPALAAVFVYGREAITSKMFLPLMRQLKSVLPIDQQSQLSVFTYYCQRHIELDHTDHLPKAMTMLAHLIPDDSEGNITMAKTARQALTARLDFLSGVEQLIQAGH